ncbi:hypothetical protein O6H91_04G020800 [Diphasiastrum complanatum]|uniref:Uncharacterized protein n=2 Tax=Diphasiastrum complanatum TaxID=34168 RepID=A0ACC2DVH1_DIPCM|nr:hypothetical protein O6H91_04G020800 [Diphasiastrum complanatum]
MALLAASGGDTIKLFDVSVETGYPCKLQYTPSPALHINCARWNHTNLVVASAGEDKKISLWLKSGRPLGTIPSSDEAPDIVEETIMSINFSTKGSRYLCSGGTGKIVRIWDMQRRRCIKWLKGHTDTITGVLYNCKDEHLASISVQGDLILHNLASGSRVTELKDPHNQVLRVLDCSRLSRHLMVTAGDDGSVHLWDTTARNPKVSWINQHLAPTSGVCFSPCSDKMIVSVGLDKKLYSFDPGMKKPALCFPCEAPFSSLTFRDDGGTLAAGTNNGRVNFYDIRSKLQPFTSLRAYGSSEPVTSLSWQRSNPISVDEANCLAEVSLLGSAGEDALVMPDPRPGAVLGFRNRSVAAAMAFRTFGRLPSSAPENSVAEAAASGTSGSVSFTSLKPQSAEETPSGSHLMTNGKMSWLQTARSFSVGKDDMEVFSPIVDVQPITPSDPSYWDANPDSKNCKVGDELQKVSVKSPPAGVRRLVSDEEAKDEAHQKLERRLASHLDDFHIKSAPTLPVAATPVVCSKGDRSPSITPPEAWGGDGPTDRSSFRAYAPYSTSRVSLEPPTVSQSVLGHELSSASIFPSTQGSDPSPNFSTYRGQSGFFSGAVEVMPLTSMDAITIDATLSTSPRQLVEQTAQLGSLRVSTFTSADGLQYRAESERHNEHGIPAEGSDFLKSEPRTRLDSTNVHQQAASNGHLLTNLHRNAHQQGTTSFALQLVQRALEESLGSVRKAIHEDVQNLHLDLLRQFHIQQTEMAAMMENLRTKQADLMEEIQALRKENQQLRHFF